MKNELRFRTDPSNANVVIINRYSQQGTSARMRRRQDVAMPHVEVHCFSEAEYDKLKSALEIIRKSHKHNPDDTSTYRRILNALKR